jgi:hypothetical protein
VEADDAATEDDDLAGLHAGDAARLLWIDIRPATWLIGFSSGSPPASSVTVS